MTYRSAACTATSGAHTLPGAVQSGNDGSASPTCRQDTRSVDVNVCTLPSGPFVAKAKYSLPTAMICGSAKLPSYTGLQNIYEDSSRSGRPISFDTSLQTGQPRPLAESWRVVQKTCRYSRLGV